jgi:hypothetical protein
MAVWALHLPFFFDAQVIAFLPAGGG